MVRKVQRHLVKAGGKSVKAAEKGEKGAKILRR